MSTLVADIGATNGRLAVVENGALESISSMEVADFPSLESLVGHYLETLQGTLAVTGAVIAVAGPVEDQAVEMTNLRWRASSQALEAALGINRVRLINDFEAIARAIPELGRQDRVELGRGRRRDKANAVVLGPGSGVGVAAMIHTARGPAVVTTEGGHATLPTVTGLEDEVVAVLREHTDNVSIEHVLCGQGIVRLYEAISRVRGRPVLVLSPGEVTEKAESGTCPVCVETLAMYFSLLGTVAGDLALGFDARGGVYLAGGILPRLTGSLVKSAFRVRFEAKSPFQAYLADIPTDLIVHPFPGLLGAASCRGEDLA